MSGTYPITEVGGVWPGKSFVSPPIGILIHSMSEYLETLHAPIWLRDKAKLSAHCFISPEGGRHIGQSPDKTGGHRSANWNYSPVFAENKGIEPSPALPGLT